MPNEEKKIEDKDQKTDFGKSSFNLILMEFSRNRIKRNKLSPFPSSEPPPDMQILFNEYPEMKILFNEYMDAESKGDRRKWVEFFIEQLKEPQYIFIEIAHKLGIALHPTFEMTKETSKVVKQDGDTDTLEGIALEVGFHWLAELFTTFGYELGSASAEQIIQKICFLSLAAAYKKAAETTFQPAEAAKKFVETGQLLIVPANMALPEGSHAIGMALIGDRLIYTNTGSGVQGKNSGTFIYKIPDTGMITGEFLKKMSEGRTLEEFEAALKSVVSLKDPIFIPSKFQKIGNCALSSPKKNSKGILPCLQVFLEAISTTPPGEPIILDTDKIISAIPLFEKPYKACTSLMRDQAIDKLIDVCQKYLANPEKLENHERIKRRLIKTIATYFYNNEISFGDRLKNSSRIEKLISLIDSMPTEIREGIRSEEAELKKINKKIFKGEEKEEKGEKAAQEHGLEFRHKI